jgi:hypothetical protein
LRGAADVTDSSTAVLAAAVAVVVALVSQRSAARIAADNRSWDRRADLYMEVVRWLEQDVEALRAREPYRAAAMSEDARLALYALGSDQLDRRLLRYRAARSRAVDNLEDARKVTRLFLAMRLVQLQIRAELGSPMRLSDRVAFAVAGSRVVGFSLAIVMSRLVQRRWADQVLLPPRDAPPND